MRHNFLDIATVYQKSSKLNELKFDFATLDKLNQILKNLIPENLAKICHIGAIDEIKSTIVIFVSNQHAFNLLRNLANHLLQGFNRENLSFDNILIKVENHSNQFEVRNEIRQVDPKIRDKLIKLAIAIGKPELIQDVGSIYEKEDEFII